MRHRDRSASAMRRRASCTQLSRPRRRVAAALLRVGGARPVSRRRGRALRVCSSPPASRRGWRALCARRSGWRVLAAHRRRSPALPRRRARRHLARCGIALLGAALGSRWRRRIGRAASTSATFRSHSRGRALAARDDHARAPAPQSACARDHRASAGAHRGRAHPAASGSYRRRGSTQPSARAVATWRSPHRARSGSVSYRRTTSIGVAGGYMQVNHGKAGPLERMRAGDGFAFYSPRTSYPRRRAAAGVHRHRPHSNGTVYQAAGGDPRRPFRLTSTIPRAAGAVRPLIDELTFIRSKTHWGAAFRSASCACRRPTSRSSLARWAARSPTISRLLPAALRRHLRCVDVIATDCAMSRVMFAPNRWFRVDAAAARVARMRGRPGRASAARLRRDVGLARSTFAHAGGAAVRWSIMPAAAPRRGRPSSGPVRGVLR